MSQRGLEPRTWEGKQEEEEVYREENVKVILLQGTVLCPALFGAVLFRDDHVVRVKREGKFN